MYSSKSPKSIYILSKKNIYIYFSNANELVISCASQQEKTQCTTCWWRRHPSLSSNSCSLFYLSLSLSLPRAHSDIRFNFSSALCFRFSNITMILFYRCSLHMAHHRIVCVRVEKCTREKKGRLRCCRITEILWLPLVLYKTWRYVCL